MSMSTAPAATTPLDHALGIFADTLVWITDAVKDIPDARLAEQPQGNVNHPAWTLSHLNLTAGFLLQLLDETCPDFDPADGAKFGPGSKPVPDLSVHATKETLLRQLTQRHALLDAAIRAKHAAYFDRPSPENLRHFAPTLGRITMFLIASHESYHLGQLMQWRRAAGMTK
ncbi:MAG: DinB family protein [Planctomycetes bacterium]|nr:DinB family protein [Planctomycetota bacterium]